MKPYYERGGITIYHGDAREMSAWKQLPGESVITDPVWPNSAFPEVANPQQLLSDVLMWAGDQTKRIVIHLGCDSDPRFLAAVPNSFPFFRTCWLEYACPHYKGRLLYGSDVAYVFGEPPPSRKGAHALPGKKIATRKDRGFVRGSGRSNHEFVEGSILHPAPRKPEHVRWLVKYYGGASVFDPFMGSGTTALACKEAGIPYVGMEIREEFCELAVSRLSQEVLNFSGEAIA